ncbi:unnamed protein product [Peronospora destructor]|uniref:WASH complex subunit 3 n=1 Tax=Peronospora destructor TaxID=86335 RepID=A0AAV0V7Z2_9STRA|nr:unnamed protein product [Peronospora destructor]
MSTSSALVVSTSPAPAPPEEEVELPIDLSQLPSIPAAKSLLLINNFVANTTRFLNHFAHECEERITHVSNNVTRVEILLAILEAKLNSIPDLSVTDAEVAAAADGNLNPNVNQIDLGISDQDLPSMETAAANGTPLPPPPDENGSSIVDMAPLPPPPPPPPSMDGMKMALVVPPPPPLGSSSPAGSMPPPLPPSMGDSDDAEVEVKSDGPSMLKLKDDPFYAKYFTMRRLGIPEQVIKHKLLMDGMNANILDMDPERPSPSGGLAPMMDLEPSGPILPIMAPVPTRSVEESDSDDERMTPPLPYSPPSLVEPRNAQHPPSTNIGMPFPAPGPPISPTQLNAGESALLLGDGPPPPPPPPSAAGRPALPESEMESSSDDDIEEFGVDDPLPAAVESSVMKLKDDPAFEKYFKMRKLGMPYGLIQHKLMMDGVTLDILNMDSEGPSPNATGAALATSKIDPGQPPLPPGLQPPPSSRPIGGLPPPPVQRYDDSDSDFDSD